MSNMNYMRLGYVAFCVTTVRTEDSEGDEVIAIKRTSVKWALGCLQVNYADVTTKSNIEYCVGQTTVTECTATAFTT